MGKFADHEMSLLFSRQQQKLLFVSANLIMLQTLQDQGRIGGWVVGNVVQNSIEIILG